MKEPKQKPKMEKPKLLEEPGAVARDARAILTEHYRHQAQERQAGSIGQQEDSPTEYATQRVETAARRGAAQAADTVRYSGKKTGQHFRDSRQAHAENTYTAGPQDSPDSPGPSPSKQQAMKQQKKNGPQEAHTTANAQPSQAGRSSAMRGQRATDPQGVAKRKFRLKRAKDVKLEQQSIRQAAVRGEEQRELSSSQAAQRQKNLSPQAGKKQAQSQISSRIQTTEQAKKRIRRASTAGVKSGNAAVKTAAYAKKQAAKKSRQAARKEAVKRTAQAAKATAKFAVRAAKLVVKAAAALVKGLVALVGAGGTVLVLFLIVAAVAALIASPFGVFFSGEDKSADVTPISNVVQEVNAEFNQRIEDIKQAHSYVDSVEIYYPGSADNIRVDNWMDVVTVFAVKTAMDTESGMDVVTIDTTRIDLMKAVFWDMNSISYEIETIEHTETETIVHEDGTTSEETTTTYEYILHITITSKTAEQQAVEYGFTDDQTDMLKELLSGEYDSLFWALLGASGYYGTGAGAVGIGMYIWPSETSDYVTSFFGTRLHPVLGVYKSHNGIDIGAAYGTDILAAAEGTVVTAAYNADGYGYYIVINHGNSFKTLYAHMSKQLVSVGQTVSQGDVIGLVGSTGMSTGPHIHFETYVNGSRVDPLGYFTDYTAAW